MGRENQVYPGWVVAALAAGGALAVGVAIVAPMAGIAVLVALIGGGVVAARRADTVRRRQIAEQATRHALEAEAGAARIAQLEQQRDALAEYIGRVHQWLREPVADARREPMRALRGLEVEVRVGPAPASAVMTDLTRDHGVFWVRREVARRIVPGSPVGVRIVVGDAVIEPEVGPAVAPISLHGPSGDVAWLVRFGSALDRAALPRALWEAVAVRGAHRVRPPASCPATATLLAPFGDVPAEVEDVSATGVGLVVELEDPRLGQLEGELTVRLTFPTMGRMAVLAAELCHMRPAGGGVRLGLRFRGGQPDVDHVERWLAASQAASEAPPETSAPTPRAIP